ncbi:MAG: sodium:alanine symporter family protein [Gemmatimonadota bacterium]|nr:sodium:alanine symporter family protein [Gemmatimonadota bacterium]MDH5197166.1 sodium:alanine symporter family protein [Gemmatimonadota bacterium]
MDFSAMADRILAVDGWVWQPLAMPLILLIVGGWLTIRTGFVQITRFPMALRMVLAGAFAKKVKDSATITPFQALTTALAATVGNGNIGGVATAILIGGPGAVFWMWICATVGMATKYAEATLGVHYRVRRETGELASGPMYYISRGIPNAVLGRVLAAMFALFGAATALFGTGNMAQSNTVARTFVEASRTIFKVEVPLWVPGLLVTVLVGLVLLGGIHRIAGTAEKLVPTMITVYVLTAIAYIVMNAGHLPHVFALIFSDAFTPTAAAGGFIGASVAQGIQAGVSRGVLSNEAGLGSAPIAHGIANVKHPVEQGTVGVFEVFTDTIVVCSMTAFVILSSGLWTDAAYQGASGDLTAAAMSTSIPFASAIVALSSFLFGFSTLIAWCYYGEKCVEYLFGSRVITPFRIVFTALILVGSVTTVRVVWALGTLLNGFMAFPNLIGLAFLGGTLAKLTRDYFSGARQYDTVPDAPGAGQE